MRGITFGEKTLVMGVVNVTPDSFYSESRSPDRQKAVERAVGFAESGADIVDIGGVSTRPGSEGISSDEELERVIPVVEGVRNRSEVLVSVDTYRPEVAREAVDSGADIINDISGLSFNNGLENTVAELGIYIVLMHLRGKPADMQEHAVYSNVVREVSVELDSAVEKALHAGIEKSKIIIDPGIGFAKLAGHNLSLLKHLPILKQKGYPVLVGLSRKSFIGAATGLGPQDRLTPTIAANAISIFQGADIIRVHDVPEAVLTSKICDALKKAQ
jgi:dihydropteroate synthase